MGLKCGGRHVLKKQISKMQGLQNSIMRWICDARRGTRINYLLDMTGMLSIRQLTIFRVLMLGLTTCWDGAPRGMSQWHEEKTRKLQTTRRSFRYVFGKVKMKLPASLASGNPRRKTFNKRVGG